MGSNGTESVVKVPKKAYLPSRLSITHKGFKILRTEHNSYWVANPQSEASGKFYDMLEFLDWELEQEVKVKIISAYQKMLQSRTVIPETAE